MSLTVPPMSDVSSRFKAAAPETVRYTQLVKIQRDGKDWTPYYAVSGVISVSLQREISLWNLTAETWACSITGGRGRASNQTRTNEHHNGGNHAQ